MTTARKKAGPPGGAGSPEHKAALIEHKRPRGRPATGRTPDKIRKAKSRAALVEGGGRELNMSLPPEQAAQLDAIKAHHGYDSDRTAVFALLALGAKRIKK